MRQWNVDPKLLCKKHLLGEHVECHMFAGTIKKGISIDGYLLNKLVDIGTIKIRHDILVEEMKKRGMNHKSELTKFNEGKEMKTVDSKENLKELCKRCKDCKRRIEDETSAH